MKKQKDLLKNKDLVIGQEKFIQALEGIGDVLIFETRRKNRIKIVLHGLKRIEDIIKNLFTIQKKDPDKFEQLILAQEYFDLFRKNEEEAKFQLSFYPKKYLISFSTAVNQIIRIHEVAVEAKNDEISRFATYHLNWLLDEISKIPNNEIFIEQLLRHLADITRLAIKNQDQSMYAASFHWYTEIVFNRLSGGDFDLSYLELFDRYFFSSVKYIIAQDQPGLFKALVSSLVDGIHIPSYDRGKIWDYGHLILDSDIEKYDQLDKKYDLEKQIRELENSEGDLDSKDKLDSWLRRFDEFKKIIEENLSTEELKEAHELESIIKKYVDSQFKYHNLLEIVFAICSFCIFKKKGELIRHLWEYKQPPDSDASWSGHDIVPTTIDGVINLYFKKTLFDRKFDFFEDHHGTREYHEKYFLLLLAHTLKDIKPSTEGKYEQIENYNLPELHVYRLSHLEYSVDNLVKIAESLKTQTDLIRAVGLDINRIEEIFECKLICFLKNLKSKAFKRIHSIHQSQPLSIKKIDEFKDHVINSFNETSKLRNILKYYGLYNDKTNMPNVEEKDRFGINIVDDKAAFFGEWHVHFGDWGKQYGSNMARSEDLSIINEIISNCTEINKSELDQALDKFGDLSNAILLTSSVSFYRHIKDPKMFKARWHKGVKQLDINGFQGWYTFNGKDIPIFKCYQVGSAKQISILNKCKLGSLIQYSPLNTEDNNELQKDIFFINVRSFSENEDLIKEFIEKAPNWLKEHGSKVNQENYLKERVIIEIYERFEFNKHDNFVGYKIEFDE